MPRGKARQDTDMLTHALLGYEHKKAEIDMKIREIRSLIGGSKSSATVSANHSEPSVPAVKPANGRKRVLSPEARKRIAAAQKKRWAEHRKNTAQAE